MLHDGADLLEHFVAGDVITVRNRPNLRAMYKNVVESIVQPQCDWINFDPESLTATITSLPDFEDVSLPVDVGQVETGDWLVIEVGDAQFAGASQTPLIPLWIATRRSRSKSPGL